MSDSTPRILIVEDDLATRLIASEALLYDGFMTSEAEDGIEALDSIGRNPPAVVLLDVNLPGADGFEICRKIRHMPGGAAIPVVMMTASDDAASVEQAFEAGANDFITKPLSPTLLGRRVRFVLRASSALATARDNATLLSRAQRLAGLAHWQVGVDRRFTWSSNPYSVFWPDAPAGTPPATELLSLVHPEDVARVSSTLLLHCSHTIDYRLVFPDGSERWVHQEAELIETDAGKVLYGATQDVTAERRTQLQVAQLAYYDDLTGIPNTQFVARYLRQGGGAARRAVVVDLGVSTFESLPRPARESLVRMAAMRLIERVRAGDRSLRLDQPPVSPDDYPGRTLVARTGAYELTVLSEVEPDQHVASVARQIADAFSGPFPTAHREVTLRVRLGVAEFPEPVDELRHLYNRAQAALQEAERVAPRDIAIYSERLRERQQRQASLARQLTYQLQQVEAGLPSELAVSYVSRRDAHTSEVIGVRALPAWQTSGAASLAGLLADDVGLAARFAMWTFSTACRDVASWTGSRASHRLSIEVGSQLLAIRGSALDLLRRARDAGLALERIDLEVRPGSCDPAELERAGVAILELRAAGMRAYLADVGPQCELQTLIACPFDGIRIDGRTFERGEERFLTRLVQVARALDLRIVAVDVDTPALQSIVAAADVDEVAGLAIEPLPAAARAS